MRPFDYQRAVDTATAAQVIGSSADGRAALNNGALQLLAGGTTLLDLMKLDVMRPTVLLDITPLTPQWSAISSSTDGLRLGALAKMADAAEHDAVKRDYPVIAQSLQLAASAQLRNMATLGGNVLQRTRCNYFRDVSYPNCNKRSPGSGCAAIGGVTRRHAVLGTSDACIATYPGDFAQALIALDANVDIAGRSGSRSIAFADLHQAPGATPHVETALMEGDVITGFRIPGRWPRSVYLKARDRQSYEFALASAAVALDTADGVVRDARIAIGGVATVPWRARDAENVLKGKRLGETMALQAGDAALQGAQPQKDNGFKIALGRQVVARALLQAGKMEI